MKSKSIFKTVFFIISGILLVAYGAYFMLWGIGMGKAPINITNEEIRLEELYEKKFNNQLFFGITEAKVSIKYDRNDGIYNIGIGNRKGYKINFNIFSEDSLNNLAQQINLDFQKVMNHKKNHDSLCVSFGFSNDKDSLFFIKRFSYKVYK